tara:strand:+ start:1460 stop:2281 length:822 start_codon:yes stop_codon:yes gene_type:complete
MTIFSLMIDETDLVTFELYDTAIAKKWFNLFQETVGTCEFNNRECFYGYASEDQAIQDITDAAYKINNFLSEEYVVIPPDLSSQDDFNKLHTVFETLNGEYGKGTQIFNDSPAEIREAIRRINFCIHRLERRRQKKSGGRIYISFDKDCYTRQPFEKDDYQHFEFEKHPKILYIHYAEVGKNLIDLYLDGLPLDYPGVKNSHYYSAESDVVFKGDVKNVFPEGFVEWCNDFNIDPYDKSLGIGVIPAARLINASTNIFSPDSKIVDIKVDKKV